MKRLCAGAIILLIFASLVACQANFSDISNQQKSTLINPLEKGNYYNPVWMSDNLLVFNYKPSNTNPSTTEPELRFYNLDKGTWGEIPVILDSTCSQQTFSFLQRLPDQLLGFLRICANGGNPTSLIEEIDIRTGQMKTLPYAGLVGSAGQFSYSPDMTEFVQEENDGFASKLFYRKGGISTQIMTNFERAMKPSWSPHNRKIVFWGTENNPSGKPTELKTLEDMGDFFFYPWDLYVSTPEGSNIEKVLTGVKEPSFIQWSPTEEAIAFGGTFEGLAGVWLTDMKTSKTTRIWSKASNFLDWSPDGKKLVVLDYDLDANGSFTNQRIEIIQIK